MLKTLCIAALVAGVGCATTETESTTWRAPQAEYVRPGQVESVREVVHRVHGNPGAGAVAGAVVGGLLTHRLWGAAGGAAVGAAASSGSSESHSYEVRVRFDDGAWMTFIYDGYEPFGPGQRVVLDRGQLQPDQG
jgi:outer membrane lipoprotein SlyB